MAKVKLYDVLHRAPIVIIDGLLMDENLWRFDEKEIRCGFEDEYWQFPTDQEVDLSDQGTLVAVNTRGVEVIVQVKNSTPFTSKDIPS